MARPSRLPRTGPLAFRYRGWVALAGSKVVGTGRTADEALAAAQLSQIKESFVVVYLPPDDSPLLELPPLVERVSQALPDPAQVWLVGGSVRDILMNRPAHDLDFAVAGDGLAVARGVADRLGGAYFALDESRGTGRVVLRVEGSQFTLDFARLRGQDLTDDLSGRDFSVNAIAASLEPIGRVFDPMGGQNDIKDKILRMCHPDAFVNDPVRALRAVRLAAQLNFRIERASREGEREAAPLISNVSAERIRDEFMRALGGRKPAACLRAMDSLGLLGHIVPEVGALKGVTQSAPHVHDVWEHTVATVDRLEALLSVLGRAHDLDAASEFALGYASARVGRFRNQLSDHLEQQLSVGRPARCLLFLAALLHDVSKPETRTVDAATGRIRFLEHEGRGAQVAQARAAQLRLSRDEVERVGVVVAHHMRPSFLTQQGEGHVTARAAYHFYKATGAAGVDVCLLSLADLWGARGSDLGQDEWGERVNTVVTLLDAYFTHREEIVAPPALLTGDDVMTLLGVLQGPQVGAVLEALREAQSAGEVVSREQALEWARLFVADGRSGINLA